MRLIDIFKANGELWCWLVDNGKNVFFPCLFYPKIYVFSTRNNLETLQKLLLNYNIPSNIVKQRTLKGVKTVLEITSTVKELKGLIRDINKHANYAYEIFHADIPIEEYYLFTHNVFPTSNVDVVVNENRITNISTKDIPTDEYDIPKLNIAYLTVQTSYSLRKNMHPELQAIQLNEEIYEGKDKIPKFVNDFNKLDPDIIITGDGNLELPYLLTKIRKEVPAFNFSRFGTDTFKVDGNSYFSYGKIHYKYRGVKLKGRLHFQQKGVLYGKWDLWYPFELARMCRVTLQTINHRSVGYGVANLQMYYAMKKKILIPYKSSCGERWTSGYNLFNADRGALTYEPVIGFHTDTAELDFISMFPTIMVKYNISPETMFCKCCKDNKVPGLAMHICRNEKGLIPALLEPVIKQRLKYKKIGTKEHLSRANALKGILVTCFGYMGFKKSKFGRIEAHQAIQAYARESLLKTSKIAEELGFEVIHGIVDSLYVKKKNINKKILKKLIQKIHEEVQLPIKLEGMYRWIVFLPSTLNKDLPVPTRYYGVFSDGELKLRGIETQRRDTPELIVKLQKTIIKELAQARNKEEFLALLDKSLRHLNKTISRLLKGDIAQQELLIKKAISKTEYKAHTAQAIVLKQLQDLGFEPKEGNVIRYVISDQLAPIPAHRYQVKNDHEYCVYDKLAYIRLTNMAIKNIFSQFINVGMYGKQLTLMEALKRELVPGLPIWIEKQN